MLFNAGNGILDCVKTRYKPRICDELLRDELAGSGAVLIEGAKWCGKTTTAEQAAASAIYIDEEGKLEEDGCLVYDPQHIGRGFSVHWNHEGTKAYTSECGCPPAARIYRHCFPASPGSWNRCTGD